jgi:hypothetical protein
MLCNVVPRFGGWKASYTQQGAAIPPLVVNFTPKNGNTVG